MKDIPEEVKSVCNMLIREGHQAFLVGGCVRDFLMGLEPKDWDVATDARPEQVMKLSYWTVVPTGLKHGTVTVVLPQMHVEVTTFRIDGPSSNGRHPDSVEFGSSVQEDLARRDFTCNAVAFNLQDGTFVDPFGGQQDIEAKVLSAVGDPTQRFCEDGLRLMRAVRFMCTKGFVIGAGTLFAMIQRPELVQNVSKERIRDELMKILGSNNPVVGIEALADSGLLEFICPELLKGKDMHQNVKWHALPVWDHVMRALEMCSSPDPIVRLAVLLHDIAKPVCRAPHHRDEGQFNFLGHELVGAQMAADWMREMKFTSHEVDKVSHLIRHHLVFYEPGWSDAQVRRWVRKVGKDNVRDLLLVYEADLHGKDLPIREQLDDLSALRLRVASVKEETIHSSTDLNISGHDVMKLMGTTSGGPKVGECIRVLIEKVTESPELNVQEDLLRLAQEWLQQH